MFKFLFREKNIKISYGTIFYMSIEMRAEHPISNDKNWRGRREYIFMVEYKLFLSFYLLQKFSKDQIQSGVQIVRPKL